MDNYIFCECIAFFLVEQRKWKKIGVLPAMTEGQMFIISKSFVS